MMLLGRINVSNSFEGGKNYKIVFEVTESALTKTIYAHDFDGILDDMCGFIDTSVEYMKILDEKVITRYRDHLDIVEYFTHIDDERQIPEYQRKLKLKLWKTYAKTCNKSDNEGDDEEDEDNDGDTDDDSYNLKDYDTFYDAGEKESDEASNEKGADENDEKNANDESGFDIFM